LTKRAAEDVLEGMDSMLKPDEANVATKLAKHIADVGDTERFKDEQGVSCKISFIMSLLVSVGHAVCILLVFTCQHNIIVLFLCCRII